MFDFINKDSWDNFYSSTTEVYEKCTNDIKEFVSQFDVMTEEEEERLLEEKKRKENQAHSLEILIQDKNTFLLPITADERVLAAELKLINVETFQKSFQVDKHTETITKLLELYPIIQSFLVDSMIPYSEFWANYFYRKDIFSSSQALSSSTSWDDDDDDKESNNALKQATNQHLHNLVLHLKQQVSSLSTENALLRRDSLSSDEKQAALINLLTNENKELKATIVSLNETISKLQLVDSSLVSNNNVASPVSNNDDASPKSNHEETSSYDDWE